MAEIGSVIDNKYRVLDEIGHGGMSVVFLARDKRLEKLWAVKEIRNVKDIRKRQTIIDSLKSEAQLMKDLDHPAIVRIVDIIDEHESLYVVMDYIDGEALTKQIYPQGKKKVAKPIPEEKAVQWGIQICDVLQYLHSQKPPIIYYDLKPDNIMLRNEGDIRLIDFGAARKYSSDPKEMNRYKILGTPGYAAPEQYQSGSDTDSRTDIYTFGMTLHFMLTGHEPKATKENKNPRSRPIREYIPSLSSGLEQVIIKCTQLDPKDRYQNSDELMYALEHYHEMDEQYKVKQKSILKRFLVVAIVTGTLLFSSGISAGATAIINNNDYENLINTAGDYQTSVEAAKKAIEIKGNKAEGYLRLLKLFRDNQSFGDSESQLISGLYNANKNQFNTNSKDYLDLNFEIGRAYLFMFTGSDSTFRVRILRATDPYFNNVVASGQKDYENYAVASSFCDLGQFYRNFISQDSTKEPTKDDYTKLIDAFNVCIDTLEDYDTDDSAYMKLTLYYEVVNLINRYCDGFAQTGISQPAVESLLNRVVDKTKNLNVTVASSIEKRDEILTNVITYKENLTRAYINAAERKTNGPNT
ncbi:MAG: serine/threonine-protein kinase [Eubacterium sp.]